ncbi:MAG: hypothetical protein ACRDQA_26010 [Nocardioidaceae bacterium]
MPDDPNQPVDPKAPADPKPAEADSFSQADVDKIIGRTRDEERRKAAEKFADYDDLKRRVEGAKSLEDRIVDLEAKGSQSELRAQRAEIAGEFGISTKREAKDKPSDAELFLTGSDAESMRSQAERLSARESTRKQNGNHVPAEGPNPKPGDDPMRELTRGLFKAED